jgi:hypothetical protein
MKKYKVSTVTAKVVPSSSILVTLMMEELSSSETSVLTRATRRNIPEDAILWITAGIDLNRITAPMLTVNPLHIATTYFDSNDIPKFC